MENCLSTLDEFGGWVDDLEVEELATIQSATTIVIIIVHVPSPGPVYPLTSPQV